MYALTEILRFYEEKDSLITKQLPGLDQDLPRADPGENSPLQLFMDFWFHSLVHLRSQILDLEDLFDRKLERLLMTR